MDQMQILKRAWNILWSYRALWIFGILVALTASSGGGSGNGANWQLDSNDFGGGAGTFGQWMDELQRNLEAFFTPERLRAVVGIGIALICAALLAGVLASAARYVSQVALIRMVDQYETTGEKLTWRQGFRLGWSRAAWRLFLINLVVFVPLFLAMTALFVIAGLPVLVSVVGGNDPTPAGIVATIGLGFLAIFVLIVVIVAASLFLEIIYRVCVLENRGVIDSIQAGWLKVRRNFKDVLIMWLVLVGLGVALFILLIPVVLALLAVGLAFGGGVGAGLFFLVRALADATAGGVAAVLVGVTLLALLIGLPLLFIGGLRETYFSTIWTLTYRELDLKQAEASGAVG